MQNLNHRVWGRIRRINRKVAWIGLTAILIGMLTMLVVSAAHDVTVYCDGTCRIVSAYNDNPHDIMQKVGLNPDDYPAYELATTEEGLVLRVGPELNVTVTADGQTYRIVTRPDKVSRLLASLGITLGVQDRVAPGMDTVLNADCDIVVQRVTQITAVRKESVEPTVVYEDTDTMPEGTTAIKIPGKAGSCQVTYADTIVDGVVSESKVRKSVVLEEATQQVMLRGTAPVEDFDAVVTTNADINGKLVSPLELTQPVAVDKKGTPLNYKKCIKGLATAYTASEGKHTATGDVAQVGYIAVDPKEIPYGTMMYIKTTDGSYLYGIAKASDTGGFISGPVAVDLFFDTYEECIQFGLRDVEIYLL